MKKILVSGASGIVGYGILKSLRQAATPMLLIGTTVYEDSVAQGFCDCFERAPFTNDPGYLDWLVAVIEKHSVDLIIPGIEADMYMWAEHASEIERAGARALLNNSELISLCKDKWAFFETLTRCASPHRIDTSLETDFDALTLRFGLPFLLKPRRGYGSKGIVRVANRETCDAHKHEIGPVLMAQPIIGTDDEEFTTSAFCDGAGGVYSFMTLKRRLSKDGFTDRAEVIELESMEPALASLCRIFNPVGPTNFQFRKQDGVLKLLEINPRISSATSIRTAFGYNESAMAVGYYLENRTPSQPCIKRGKAVRYVEDFIFYENRADFRHPR